MWREWCAPWEFEDISEWNSRRSFEKVCIQPPGQLAPVFGITGLAIENGRICMRVFFNKGAACQAHGQAVRLLLERDLEDAIAWAWRDFSKSVRIPFQVRELMEELEAAECLEQVFSAIVTDPGYDLPEDPEAFSRLKALALQRLRLAGQETVDIVLAVLPEYAACLNYLLERMKSDRNTAAQTEHLARCERLVEEYIEILFQPAGRIDKIKLLPRYLRGTMHRMRMAVDKPQRYGRCVQMLDEFYTEVRRLRKKDQSHLPDIARLLDEFEEMVEEYALTVFAHGQIAPRFPVSEPRLRRSLEELESAVSEKEC
jgi:hypothetical protein